MSSSHFRLLHGVKCYISIFNGFGIFAGLTLDFVQILNDKLLIWRSMPTKMVYDVYANTKICHILAGIWYLTRIQTRMCCKESLSSIFAHFCTQKCYGSNSLISVQILIFEWTGARHSHFPFNFLSHFFIFLIFYKICVCD